MQDIPEIFVGVFEVFFKEIARIAEVFEVLF